MDSTAQSAVISYKIVKDENSEIVNAKLNGGHEYNGPMTMNGNAHYKWNDGTSYSGDFQNGEMTGFAVYNFQNATYDGHVYCGIRHGYGTLLLHDTNTKYIGEWSNGKPNGKGILYYNGSDTEKYDGNWVNGKREGHGICVYKNGDEYDGEWSNNYKNGNGTMKWKSFKEIYFGEWKEDEPNGKGIHLICNDDINIDTITMEQLRGQNNFTSFNNLNWYYGQWKNGQRNGFGIYHYSNGAQYCGEYYQNKKHGKGEYIYENGAKFMGEFENDTPKYESKEQSDMTQKQTFEQFVLNINDGSESFDLDMAKNVILRHWKLIQNIFPRLCTLNKLWIVMELLKLKESTPIYEINKSFISVYTIYENNKCDITDPNHAFLFRQFVEILVRISMFYKQNLDEMLISISNTAFNNFFWSQLPIKYQKLWSNEDSKSLFEEKYVTLTNTIRVCEDINDHMCANYIDGNQLKEIMENLLTNSMIESVMIKEFENCYFSKESNEVLLLQKCDIDFSFESMKFLVEECRLFFAILICIKISYEIMLSAKERIEKEKEQRELEELERQKGKKSKKGKKKKIEEPQSVEPENNEEIIDELKLIDILPQHVSHVYDQVRIVKQE